MNELDKLEEEILDRFAELVNEDFTDATTLAASVLIALLTSRIEAEGEDPEKEIMLNNGYRDITIHALKTGEEK